MKTLTVVPSQWLVHWVQPAETNQVPFPLQQSGKPVFPITRVGIENKYNDVVMPSSKAVKLWSYLSVYFIGNDIHKLIVSLFSTRRTRTPFCYWHTHLDAKTSPGCKEWIISEGFFLMVNWLVQCAMISLSRTSYLWKVKKSLWGSFLKLWAMRTAISRSRPRLVCQRQFCSSWGALYAIS